MTDSTNPLFGNLEESSSPESTERNESEGAVGGSTSLAVRKQNYQPSTRSSLLVEALVKCVVSAYQPNNTERSRRAYKKICRCLQEMGLIDESWRVKELEGVRLQFENALFRLLDPPVSSAPPFLLRNSYSSQYQSEFDELDKIGGGGYGKVFRVRHKLDGREYAVKKIPIRSESLYSVKNYLSEVKTFASLNHPNIVQYRAAWLELRSPQNFNKPINNVTKRLADTSFGNYLYHSQVVTHSLVSTTNEMDTRSTSGIPTKIEPFLFHKGPSLSSLNNKKTESDNGFEIAFEHSNKEENSSNTKSQVPEKALVPTIKTKPIKSKISWATLYIQMALCHGTLDQWLRRRNEKFTADVALMPNNAQALRTKAILQILIQILRGLEYIHSKGIVHHDIKPSNIFISAEPESGSLLVQLGDFGLACPLQRTCHSFARGTPLYAAPEQLNGRCDPKSDMYSVGIVLFELLEDFGTDMERNRRISELRGRSDPPIPTDLGLTHLVSALVRFKSSERPDATTLLNALDSPQEASKSDIEDLRKSLKEKEREIKRLKELLEKHGIDQ